MALDSEGQQDYASPISGEAMTRGPCTGCPGPRRATGEIDPRYARGALTHKEVSATPPQSIESHAFTRFLMKRFFISMTAALLMVALVSSAAMAAPKAKYLTFGTGDVTQTGGIVTIVNDAGEYGGVYLNAKSHSGKPLASVDFSFTLALSGDALASGVRVTVPIDKDGNGSADDYASIGANNCVDPTDVTTVGSNCQVFLNSDGTNSQGDWDTFAAANPTWRVAPGDVPFIIADSAGTYTISNIDLR
jgi:hypothetical protein